MNGNEALIARLQETNFDPQSFDCPLSVGFASLMVWSNFLQLEPDEREFILSIVDQLRDFSKRREPKLLAPVPDVPLEDVLQDMEQLAAEGLAASLTGKHAPLNEPTSPAAIVTQHRDGRTVPKPLIKCTEPGCEREVPEGAGQTAHAAWHARHRPTAPQQAEVNERQQDMQPTATTSISLPPNHTLIKQEPGTSRKKPEVVAAPTDDYGRFQCRFCVAKYTTYELRREHEETCPTRLHTRASMPHEHHYKLDTPKDGISHGVCKTCGATRDFTGGVNLPYGNRRL